MTEAAAGVPLAFSRSRAEAKKVELHTDESVNHALQPAATFPA
jgi:hypothetical protein